MSSSSSEAVGMIELSGLSRGLLAANLACHAAAVTVEGVGYVQGGTVMLRVRGDVSSVEAAVRAATSAFEGSVRAVSVIPRPDAQLEDIMLERTMLGAGARRFGEPGGIGSTLLVGATPSRPPAPTKRSTAEQRDGRASRTKRKPGQGGA